MAENVHKSWNFTRILLRSGFQILDVPKMPFTTFVTSSSVQVVRHLHILDDGVKAE